MKKLLTGLFLLLAAALPVTGFAVPSDRVVIINSPNDPSLAIYPSADVTIEEGAELPGPVFIGGSPIFGGSFVLNIFLTEPGTNLISDHLFSGGSSNACELAQPNGQGPGLGDCIYFTSDADIDALIGTLCTGGPAFCREEDGTLQDVTDMVNAQIQQNATGQAGIFGNGRILIQSDVDLPEPATALLLALGLAGLGFTRRARKS